MNDVKTQPQIYDVCSGRRVSWLRLPNYTFIKSTKLRGFYVILCHYSPWVYYYLRFELKSPGVYEIH